MTLAQILGLAQVLGLAPEIIEWYLLEKYGSEKEHFIHTTQSDVQRKAIYYLIRESVDSLCRDGADAKYMQYLKAKAV